MSKKKKREAKDSGNMIIARMEWEIVIERAENNFKCAVRQRMAVKHMLDAAKSIEKDCLIALNEAKREAVK